MDKYYKPAEQISGYSVIQMIGKGRYGIVYLAENKESEKFIIKQLKNDTLETSKDKLFFEQEILKSLNSTKFPRFIEKLETEELQAYVLEYIPGRVFEDLIVKDAYRFSKGEIYTFASQLLEIINILHQNNIVHRDIRVPNVILKENKELVLIDFGLARYIDHKKYIKEMDYWYVGDFLIHLYYTSYDQELDLEEKPWYEELDLNEKEKTFLKKLMGIETSYKDMTEIEKDLQIIKNKG